MSVRVAIWAATASVQPNATQMGIASRTWDNPVAFVMFEPLQGYPIAVYHNYAQNNQTHPRQRLTYAAFICSRLILAT
jgi:hypothetical protein